MISPILARPDLIFRRRTQRYRWEDPNYCWVVLCKNHWFHMRQNFLFRHKIPLAETDAVTPLPPLGKPFTVRCDECRRTYTYRPKDVRRIELELPASFKPHPLFQEEPLKTEALADSDRSTEQPRQTEAAAGGTTEQGPVQGETRQGSRPQKHRHQTNRLNKNKRELKGPDGQREAVRDVRRDTEIPHPLVLGTRSRPAAEQRQHLAQNPNTQRSKRRSCPVELVVA